MQGDRPGPLDAPSDQCRHGQATAYNLKYPLPHPEPRCEPESFSQPEYLFTPNGTPLLSLGQKTLPTR